MSQIFGWVPADGDADAAPVLDRMAAALRVADEQRISRWPMPGVGVGVVEPPALAGTSEDSEPAQTPDGRFSLWMTGEAFWSGELRSQTSLIRITICKSEV